MIRTHKTSLIDLTGVSADVFALLEAKTFPLANVGLWDIPKDIVRDKIFKMLDDPSRIAARFVCRAFRDLIEQPKSNKEFSQKAARQGYFSLLKWTKAKGCPWDEQTCSSAAEGGHLNILQ